MKLLIPAITSLPLILAKPEIIESSYDATKYSESCTGWHYGAEVKGPAREEDWNCGYCTGTSQSPRDINSKQAEKVKIEDMADEFLSMIGPDPIHAATVANEIFEKKHAMRMTGYKEGSHSLTYTFEPEVVLSNGYKAAQFHMHVGNSEHTLNDHYYDGELHIVTYHSKFADLGAAVGDNKAGNLAVLGFFLEEHGAHEGHDHHDHDEDEENYDYSVDWVKTLPTVGNTESREDGSLFNMNVIPNVGQDPFALFSNYYRYEGSLTTPTCNEVVTWTVFKEPLLVSPTFRKTLDDLEENFGHTDFVFNSRPPVSKFHNDNPVTYYSGSAGLAFSLGVMALVSLF